MKGPNVLSTIATTHTSNHHVMGDPRHRVPHQPDQGERSASTTLAPARSHHRDEHRLGNAGHHSPTLEIATDPRSSRRATEFLASTQPPVRKFKRMQLQFVTDSPLDANTASPSKPTTQQGALPGPHPRLSLPASRHHRHSLRGRTCVLISIKSWWLLIRSDGTSSR